MNPEVYAFTRRLPDGSTYRLGTATRYPHGWRFMPNVVGRRASRKSHPTLLRCLPQWLGYPRCCRCERLK